MATKSKKKLFEALDEYFGGSKFSKLGLKHQGIGDETYGRDSRIYIYDSCYPFVRSHLENFLDGKGFRVHRSYSPGQNVLEVGVTYFKGANWNV